MTQRPALKPLVYYNVQLCGARTAARYHFHDVWMTMLIIVQYSAPAVYIRGAGAHWGSLSADSCYCMLLLLRLHQQ